MSEKIDRNSEVLPEIDYSATERKIKKEKKPGKSEFVEPKSGAPVKARLNLVNSKPVNRSNPVSPNPVNLNRQKTTGGQG